VDGKVQAALEKVAQGAGVIDVGGQTINWEVPEVSVQEELDRIVPVIAGLRSACDVPISVDTYRPDVARAAVDAGADIINDAYGLMDEALADVAARTGAALVVSHNLRPPKDRDYPDDYYVNREHLVASITGFFHEKLAVAARAGVPRDRLVVDPGPDLTKSPAQTVAMLQALPGLVPDDLPVLLAIVSSLRARAVPSKLIAFGEVGLAGMEERETGGLSGGELQRLAVASALARQPAMLIADEVTTMVDQRGREALLGVLSGLTERHRMALVHITHYNNEAETADRTVNLSESLDNMVMVSHAAAPTSSVHPAAVRSSEAVLELTGVCHEYASGTPWAKTALRDITFTVNEGEGVLIHGGNGSGKSTLAWIMAGLTTPTTGACLVGGQPAHERVGDVAIAFQAARLQLLRSRVDLEVASAAGFSPHDTGRVAAALATVGLDGSLIGRRVDQLSGGQMRRVVIA
jgi:dihydropteroate synthase